MLPISLVGTGISIYPVEEVFVLDLQSLTYTFDIIHEIGLASPVHNTTFGSQCIRFQVNSPQPMIIVI